MEGQGPRGNVLGTFEEQAPESSCLGLTLDRELMALQGGATCLTPTVLWGPPGRSFLGSLRSWKVFPEEGM